MKPLKYLKEAYELSPGNPMKYLKETHHISQGLIKYLQVTRLIY